MLTKNGVEIKDEFFLDFARSGARSKTKKIDPKPPKMTQGGPTAPKIGAHVAQNHPKGDAS